MKILKFNQFDTSLGCVDYGQNNFFEVMVNSSGEVGLSSHDDSVENGVVEGITIEDFIDEVKDREDFADIMKDLTACLAQRR